MLRDLIPIRRVVLELVDALSSVTDIQVGVPTTIHQDNDATRLLATGRHITNRTCYWLVKWHHFWIFMDENAPDSKDPTKTPNSVIIIRCPTNDMIADYLTKGLVKEPFQYLRLKAQGW